MANLPDPEKSSDSPPAVKSTVKSPSKLPDNMSDNRAQTGRSVVRFVYRGAILAASAIAGLGIGLAIALVKPEWVWQPSLNFLSYQKQQFTLSVDALFDGDKTTIRPESFSLLDEVAAQLPLAQGKLIRINGHTDSNSMGDVLNISYLQAAAVKDYLARLRGEQNYYWTVVGYGASRPLASSAGELNSRSNRRIEIFVDD